MLDPSLPWLAVGYKNFKQEDFCQRQIKDEMNKYRIDTTDVLRSTTPQRQQRRRVKSATHSRFIPRCGSSSPAYASSPARPKSAQSYHHKTTFSDQIAERSPSRQQRPRSAFLSHHRPSHAQNRSISMVEREHHEEKMIRLFVDDRDKKCAFCPVECRPKSSSSNRPTSSTGLVAAQLPTHYDRYVYCTRPRTAPATRREFLQLPRRNNIRRGQVPHYTNFVRRVELGLRDGTPSPPPRRQIAFESEPVKPQSPSLVESSHGDVEEEEMLPSVENEEEFDDVSIHIPSPTDHLLVPEDVGSEEPPADESQEAWTEPKAPTPSPAMSGRNSPTPVVDDIPERPSPPPREPTPPPREPTPPLREPSPPPREPTPPPREPTPPPREPTPPPREPTPPPREPTPPPEPKPKKEVRIQETPILLPAEPKTFPQPTDKKTKSCLVKKAEIPKEPEQKKPEPPAVPTPEVAPVEDEKPVEVVLEVSVEEIEDEPQDERQEEEKSQEEKQPEETRKPEKKKLGPAPKFKVDLFSMDSDNILDMEMKLRRKGAETPTSDGDSFADIPEYLLKKRQPWQHGRMALSRRACRFEIPMDVYVLENMSPTEYLQKYCIVNKRRQAMYRRSFSKVDKDNDMKINMKEFNTAVLEALVGTVQLEQVQDVLKLIKADKFPHFGPKLFCAICSLLERLHYREFVTEDTVDQEGLVEKEKVEDADFLALDWKFDGCKINQPLKRLLYML